MRGELYAGNDEQGLPVLFRVTETGMEQVRDTSNLPAGLQLDGLLAGEAEDEDDEELLGAPPVEAVAWTILPKLANGEVVGELEVIAPVSTEFGPIWRPRVKIRAYRDDGTWNITAGGDLLEGYLRDGRIRWDGGGGDSHGETIAAFLSQPLDTARIASLTKLVK